MLCSLLLKPEHAHGRLFNWSEQIFNAARDAYGATLRWTLQHVVFVLLGSLAVLIATVVLYGVVSKGFIPAPGYRRHQRQHAGARRYHLR